MYWENRKIASYRDFLNQNWAKGVIKKMLNGIPKVNNFWRLLKDNLTFLQQITINIE